MVIPWIGVPLAEIIKRAEPTSKATFAEFTTLMRPSEMPGQGRPAWTGRIPRGFEWTRRCIR